jgi:hypothetical protein
MQVRKHHDFMAVKVVFMTEFTKEIGKTPQ